MISDTENEERRYRYSLIRGAVSARDVGRVLGMDVDGHGRCRCPFHHGEDRNMMLYPEDRGFYCFVCHESGDCIKLAKELLGGDCRYSDAANWIDRTFQLGVFADRKPSAWERVRLANCRSQARERKQG